MRVIPGLALIIIVIIAGCTNTASEARHYDRAPDVVYTAARALGSEQPRWVEVEADAARGRLAWEATTAVFRFTDDVAMVVTADPAGGTHLDATSASRVGKSDFGANGRRLRSFLGELEARLTKTP